MIWWQNPPILPSKRMTWIAIQTATTGKHKSMSQIKDVRRPINRTCKRTKKSNRRHPNIKNLQPRENCPKKRRPKGLRLIWTVFHHHLLKSRGLNHCLIRIITIGSISSRRTFRWHRNHCLNSKSKKKNKNPKSANLSRNLSSRSLVRPQQCPSWWDFARSVDKDS